MPLDREKPGSGEATVEIGWEYRRKFVRKKVKSSRGPGVSDGISFLKSRN